MIPLTTADIIPTKARIPPTAPIGVLNSDINDCTTLCPLFIKEKTFDKAGTSFCIPSTILTPLKDITSPINVVATGTNPPAFFVMFINPVPMLTRLFTKLESIVVLARS